MVSLKFELLFAGLISPAAFYSLIDPIVCNQLDIIEIDGRPIPRTKKHDTFCT
jgi:hypothetical protein